MEALELLLGRQSCHALVEPGPDEAQLELILRAALRVPDFQNLKPFRFVVAQGDGRARLGALYAQAAQDAGRSAAEIERAPKMPLRAPVVITVVATPKPSVIVPAFEQFLTAGCAVMAMQMAAFALGLAGVWRSGWPMADAGLARLLGLADEDKIVGFLYIGTAAKPYPPLPEAEPGDFIMRL